MVVYGVSRKRQCIALDTTKEMVGEFPSCPYHMQSRNLDSQFNKLPNRTRKHPMVTHVLPRKQTAPSPKLAHKPLKGCPENDYYEIIKPRQDCFQIILKSTGMVMFTTVNKTIAVETLEGMLL